MIGNGFDLAHGLKTSYRDFLDWYICKAFNQFCEEKSYLDKLIEIKNTYTGQFSVFEVKPKCFEDVIKLIEANQNQSINYFSNFFRNLLMSYKSKKWVDVERYYFNKLKFIFSNPNVHNKEQEVDNLNKEFDFLILQLAKYIKEINGIITKIHALNIRNLHKLNKVFEASSQSSKIKVLNFNYTETVIRKHYAIEDEVIYIHGRVTDIENNPIIFGYGDESDPVYQNIEDSGENLYLEHIKSFGYFQTNNYHQLLSYIDSEPYVVYIIGHSCGLSDRVLLNQIFEHKNCEKIEIFFHLRKDGTDNFKEITQEISRHFKPNNKSLMRRRVGNKDFENVIPQNQ